MDVNDFEVVLVDSSDSQPEAIGRERSPPKPSSASRQVRVEAAAGLAECIVESSRTNAASGERLSNLLDISMDAAIATDRNHRIVFFNKGAERIFGCRADEIIGQPLMRMIPSFAVEAISLWHARSRRDDPAGRVSGALDKCREVTAFRRDGRAFPVEMSLAVLEGDGAAVSLAILRDVGEKKRVAEQVEYLATHDHLTGLPNRHLFFERLARAIDIAEQDETLMALMFIDLDGFKRVNDRLGHAAGDELLRVVAGRLRSRLRAADTVARLGGDEFAVIVEHLMHVDPISELATLLLAALSEPVVIDGATASVSASIGIVICPLEAKSCKQMMVDADRAMYAAKAAGKGRFLFYDAAMESAPMVDGEPASGAQPEAAGETAPIMLERRA